MACSLQNFIVLFLIFLKPGCITAFSSKNGTVFYTDGKYHIEFGVLDSRNGVAYGTYEDTINTTGWSVLNVVSGTGVVSYSDEVVMFAAGYLEGALTAERINENYVNNYDIFFRKSPASLVKKTAEWFDTQEEWMRNKIAKESSSSSLWRQMGHIIAQFDGLIAGYADHPATEKALGKFAFQLLNGADDYSTFRDVLNPEGLPDWDKMEENEIFTRLGRRGHCSVLIKVLPGYEDILAGHSTWFPYSAALRIYKHYHFNLKDPSTAAKRMSFSSYPGFLVSSDDFYIMDSGIAMLQTTNDIFNNSLLNFVTPESLLAWHRVRLSNLMAHNGEEWAEIYKQYNSGTYNNQYMVLDLKKVELKKPLQKGALWVVEQIPGLVVSGDQTEILSAGYWPSYNKPFYEEIYNLSGFPEFVKKHGVQYSYQLSPRAKIFRRDQGKVVDVESLKHILQYNDYLHDKYSEGNPYKAICSRGDLLIPHDRSADGCYDSKVTNYSMAKSMVSEAISGPTHQDLPVFCWSKFSFPDKHVGLPDCYNFDFVPMKPKF